MHPSDPGFNATVVADHVPSGTSYCISKTYGTFWINEGGDAIYQSNGDVQIMLCSLRPARSVYQAFRVIGSVQPHNILLFEKVCYEEQYGMSGRLLVTCIMKGNRFTHVLRLVSLFNFNELKCLKRALGAKIYSQLLVDMLYGSGVDRRIFNEIDVEGREQGGGRRGKGTGYRRRRRRRQ
eukprot:732937_1